MLTLLAAFLIGTPPAQAQELWEVDGVLYPACYLEDGSDSPTLPCVWTSPDDGRQWLTFEDYSVRIVALEMV